jgi:hypothetical protein
MQENVIPSVREILNAKVIDALIELEERKESGEITEGEWYVARQTVFQAFSGLAMPEVFDLMKTDEPESVRARRLDRRVS